MCISLFQRLRDLKQYETGRRFGEWCGLVSGDDVAVTTIGGHRSNSEAKEKMVAAQRVAIERAQMRIRQERKCVCRKYTLHETFIVLVQF